MSFGHVQSDIF